MKKSVSMVLALVLCTALTACSKVESESEKDFSDIELVRWGEPDRIVYYTLDELEEACDVAVAGTFVEDSTQDLDYQYDEFFRKDVVGLVRSENTVEVSEVLKGDVEPGDRLKIRQAYAVEDGKLISISALTPMVKGDSWVFFLKYLEKDDVYLYVGDSDGRYPVSKADNQALAISDYSQLGVYYRDDFNDDIYGEIVKKYDI